MKIANRKGTRVQIWVNDNEYEELLKLASANGFNLSELIRSLIYKQLGIDGANDGADFIRKQIREEIKIQLKAQIERLVKIIIKIGMIEVSSFFYLKAVLKLNDAALEEELWDAARKETAAYLSMKNSRAAEEVFREFNEHYSIDYDDYGGESDTD